MVFMLMKNRNTLKLFTRKPNYWCREISSSCEDRGTLEGGERKTIPPHRSIATAAKKARAFARTLRIDPAWHGRDSNKDNTESDWCSTNLVIPVRLALIILTSLQLAGADNPILRDILLRYLLHFERYILYTIGVVKNARLFWMVSHVYM